LFLSRLRSLIASIRDVLEGVVTDQVVEVFEVLEVAQEFQLLVEHPLEDVLVIPLLVDTHGIDQP
jgi:hypothetical protein